MNQLDKSIFGKTYRFTCEDIFSSVLKSSIELYPDANTINIDVHIFITAKMLSPKPRSQNPKSHQSHDYGMNTSVGRHRIAWSRTEEGTLKSILEYGRLQYLVSQIYKYGGKECSTEVELFEQVLHELVLVPSVYFFEDRVPLHSAAIRNDSKSIIFAGTGGVGKSSALLALRNMPSTGFISDDISIIDAEGKIYGNMAWPKIYGYNCKGSDFTSTLLKNRGLLDRLHFSVRNRINPNTVRRKLRPDVLYQKVHASPTRCSTLYYLFREDSSEFSISDLSKDSAISMSISVMLSEYAFFHNHIHWEEYNSLGSDTKPMLSMQEVVKNWRRTLSSALGDVEVKKISVPLNATHKAYLDQVLVWGK